MIIILQSNLLCQSLEKYQPLVLEEIWCSLIWFGLTVNLGIVCGLPHPEACLTLSGITKRLKLRVGGLLQGQNSDLNLVSKSSFLCLTRIMVKEIKSESFTKRQLTFSHPWPPWTNNASNSMFFTPEFGTSVAGGRGPWQELAGGQVGS